MRLPRKAPVPAPPLEKDVQAAVLDYLRLFGAFAIRVNSGAFAGEHNGKKRFVRFNSEPGCSDLLSVLPGGRSASWGRFAAWECKRPGFKHRPAEPGEKLDKDRRRIEEQAEFLASVRQRGGIGAFVTSIDDVRRVLLYEGYDAP